MYETIFSIANTLALLGWVLLIVFPHRRLTELAVHRGLVLLLLAMAYGVLLWQGMATGGGGGFGSLAGVRQLFVADAALLAGWLHYLAFDLFVGAWIVRDARRLAIRHWIIVLPLLLCFMLGPLGFLTYFLIRLLHQPSLSDETFA